MVMTPESREQNKLRSQLEGMEIQEDEALVENEPKQPIYWKESSPVRINALALSPEMFEGNFEYRSKGSKKNQDGNITITDEDFVRYRIGCLLAPVEEKIQDLASQDELHAYITEAIEFYRICLEEREAAHRESQKEEILVKARKYYHRYKAILIAANPQMVKWDEDKLVNWIADNMQV